MATVRYEIAMAIEAQSYSNTTQKKKRSDVAQTAPQWIRTVAQARKVAARSDVPGRRAHGMHVLVVMAARRGWC